MQKRPRLGAEGTPRNRRKSLRGLYRPEWVRKKEWVRRRVARARRNHSRPIPGIAKRVGSFLFERAPAGAVQAVQSVSSVNFPGPTAAGPARRRTRLTNVHYRLRYVVPAHFLASRYEVPRGLPRLHHRSRLPRRGGGGRAGELPRSGGTRRERPPRRSEPLSHERIRDMEPIRPPGTQALPRAVGVGGAARAPQAAPPHGRQTRPPGGRLPAQGLDDLDAPRGEEQDGDAVRSSSRRGRHDGEDDTRRSAPRYRRLLRHPTIRRPGRPAGWRCAVRRASEADSADATVRWAGRRAPR